ncbi:MAG: hypothetical protein WDW38_001005 [Sanguina aurantia]
MTAPKRGTATPELEPAVKAEPEAKVVSERWGSLTSLTSSLTSVRAADAHAHLTAGSHRAREERFRQQRQQAGDAAAGAAVGGAPTSEAGDGRDRTARPRPAEEPGSRAAAHTARDPGREAGSSRPAQGDRSRDGSGTAAAAAATAGTSSGGGGGGGDGGGGSSGRQTTRDRQQLSKDAPAGGGGASYLRDVGSDKTRMQRPSGDDSLSWRRADERGRGGGGGREEEEAKGVKAGDASSSQGGRGGRSEQSDGQRHGRDGEERGAGEAQRGGSSHHHHRSDQRGSEDAGRCPPRHHNSSSRDNTSHSSNPRRRGNAQQMDLLQGIASMDGIDGLLAQQAVFVGLGLALMAWSASQSALALAAGTLAAAAAAFGYYNKPPARIFMGDVGSGTLGLLIFAVSAMLWRVDHDLVWPVLMLSSAFLVDATLTLLTRVWRGRRWLAPGAFGRDVAGAGALEGGGKRAGSKVQRYNAEGEKERYFHDDDKSDLATLVKRAKYGDDGTDMDAAVAGNIMSRKKFKATDLDVDAEYDYDGGLEMYESKARKGGAEVQRQRDRSRQISDHSRILKAEDACTYCVASARRPRHLTISLGQSTYLMVPPRGRLVPGHVVITPAEHATSLRQVDDGVWEEVKNFQKCLIRMFAGQGQSVLFMETALDVQGHRRHATMDAIPMSDAVLEKAKGYFKKGLQEAESEWSTHAARAVIDTTNKKGLRESVPPNFPYFYVQFGYSCGYLHVVDDEKKFDANFGRQVARV